MVEPGRVIGLLCTTVNKWTKHTLCNDGPYFASCSTDTVGCGAVASREAFSGDDEGGSVWAEVEEELGYNVETQEAVMRMLQLVVAKADRDEKDCQNGESDQLNGLASQSIDGGDRDPVARNCTGADQYEIANGIAVEDFVDILSTGPANSREDDRVV